MAGEASLALGQGDVEAGKKVDQIQGRCASETRPPEAALQFLAI